MRNATDTTPDGALAICNQMLLRTRLALFGGDRETWLAAFSLPFTMETFADTRELTSKQHLIDLYDDLTKQLQLNSITDMDRRTIACDFRAPDLIHTTYETRLIQGTILVSTYVGYGHIRYIHGGWQITDNSFAATENVPHASALSGRA